MGTYLIRPVKQSVANNLSVANYEASFDNFNKGFINLSQLVSIFGGHNIVKGNDYLFDIRNDNTETLRYIANTVIRAESVLHSAHLYHYCLVYELELGQKLDTDTSAFVMFNLDRTDKPNGISYVIGHEINETKTQVRQTWRGSPRYHPVKQRDSPFHFTQKLLPYLTKTLPHTGTKDAFVGFSVINQRDGGNPLRHNYYGITDTSNYKVDDVGDIWMHKKGTLFDGRFQAAQKIMLPIFPFFSENILDDKNVLVKRTRAVRKTLPGSITEYKSQRAKSHARGGASTIFKRHFIVIMMDFVNEYVALTNEIQASVHNLNYDVEGFRRTKSLYLKAERLLLTLCSYFPNQFTFDRSLLYEHHNFKEVPNALKLRLEGDVESATLCFDAITRFVEWFRRYYVAYDKSGKVLISECAYYHTLYGGQVAPPVYTDGGVTNGNTKNTYKYRWVTEKIDRYAGTLGDAPGREVSHNDYLADTNGTAGDIEQVALTFPANCELFIALLAHFQRVCNPRPYINAPRQKGPIPGEVIRTKEQKKNARRTYPRDLGLTPIPTQPLPVRDVVSSLPNFAPLQFDLRAFVKRAAKDDAAQDDDENDDPDEPDLDEEERDRFSKKQKCLEFEKAKKANHTPTKWRNEVDAIDPADLAREEAQMYQKAIDNVNGVADVAEDVLDIATTIVAPEATPEIYAKRIVTKTLKKRGSRLLMDLLQKGADAARHKMKVEIPEGSGPGNGGPKNPNEPDPADFDPCKDVDVERHRYNPPDLGDDPESTGEEPYCRHFHSIKLAPTFIDYVTKEIVSAFDLPDYVEPVFDLLIQQAIEPRRGRKLIQKGLEAFVQYRGKVMPTESSDFGTARLFCQKAHHRLPRSGRAPLGDG